MSVRFSRHAASRLRERFPGNIILQLIEVMEEGLFRQAAEPVVGGRWKVEGLIDGRRARVIFIEDQPGMFIIVTVMWLHEDRGGCDRSPRRGAPKIAALVP